MPKAESNELETISFEDIHLQPGTRLQLLRHRGHTPEQFLSTFIGMESNEYLLLRLPRAQGTFLSFYDGEKVTVRVFSGTMISSFDASVIQTIHYPLNCLCISFPYDVKVKKVRREMRIKVDIEGKLGLEDRTTLPVRLTNISATGCQVCVDQDIGNVDGQLVLNFNLPLLNEDDMSTMTLAAKVRNVVREERDGSPVFLAGLEFVALESNAQLIVRHYVYECLVDRRQNLV
ncbi:MAG: flagellar brake protein [Methylobacillus sp.]|nr:flagellar brake protein [Methylobacillus sp.]